MQKIWLIHNKNKNDMPIFETLLPVLGSLASSGLSAGSARRRLDRANEYNSPKQQIARLREAGISPGHFYGGGGAVNSSPVQDAPQIDPDLGVSSAISKSQEAKRISIADRIAQAQLKEITTRTEGQSIKNRLTNEQLRRYNSDRDLENALKISDAQARQLNVNIAEKRNDIAMRAQALGEDRLDFDRERFIVEQNLKERQFDLQNAKTRDEMRIAQLNYLLDAARYAIQVGQLNVTTSQLDMAWRKYDSDYALWNALNSAMDGEVDWQSIAKEGLKNVPRVIAQGLRKFILGR